MSDWRIVNSTGHAENFTTAVGEAFFVQNERRILMVIEYTAHADDEVRYKATPYRPPGIDPQVPADDSADVTIASADVAVSTTIAKPDTQWFFFNLGTVATSGTNGEWHRVRTSQLEALTDVVADDAPTATNALKFSDIGAGQDIDVWLMLDANDIIFIAVSDALDAPMPFSIAV